MHMAANVAWISVAIKIKIATGFGKALHKAGEHVLMYMLIKINISINMCTKIIFKTPMTLEWNMALVYVSQYSLEQTLQ